MSSFPFTALSSSCSEMSDCVVVVIVGSSTGVGFKFSGELFRFLVSISGAPIWDAPSCTVPWEGKKKENGFYYMKTILWSTLTHRGLHCRKCAFASRIYCLIERFDCDCELLSSCSLKVKSFHDIKRKTFDIFLPPVNLTCERINMFFARIFEGNFLLILLGCSKWTDVTDSWCSIRIYWNCRWTGIFFLQTNF